MDDSALLSILENSKTRWTMSGMIAVIIGQSVADLYGREVFNEVYKAGERARELVKQILAFSRQREHELTNLKISLIVKEVLKLIRSILPATIEIRQNINIESDIVKADPTQIHQVLMTFLAPFIIIHNPPFFYHQHCSKNMENFSEREIKVIILTQFFNIFWGTKIIRQVNYSGYLPINFSEDFGLILALII